MEILKKGKKFLDVRIFLEEPKCPYCKSPIKLEYKEKLCKTCNIIEYKKTTRKNEECRKECCLPIEEDKIVELSCFPSKEYVCFKIREKLPSTVFLYIDQKATSEDLRIFLNLPEREIMSYLIESKGGKKKVAFYIGNLNFWQNLKLLKLKKEKLLSKLFNNYLQEVKKNDSKNE